MVLLWLFKAKLFWTLENLQSSPALKNCPGQTCDLHVSIIPNCLNLMFVQETKFVFLIALIRGFKNLKGVSMLEQWGCGQHCAHLLCRERLCLPATQPAFSVLFTSSSNVNLTQFFNWNWVPQASFRDVSLIPKLVEFCEYFPSSSTDSCSPGSGGSERTWRL